MMVKGCVIFERTLLSCPARNHPTLNDHVLLVTFSTVICLRKKTSKQSYLLIESIFEAQNICFGCEIAGLLEIPIISAQN